MSYPLSILFFLHVATAAAPLHAQRECAAPFIHIDAVVPSQWDAALRDACARISTARDVDEAITVYVSFHASELVLVALRPDHRETTRTVHTPDELLTTLRALVMIPPGDTAAALPQTAAESPAQPADTRSRVPGIDRELAVRQTRPVPVHVEFGAELTTRVAWTPTYISPALTLHVGFLLDAWMFGFEARAEPYQIPVGDAPVGFEMDGFGAGIFLTRRLVDDASIAFDTGARAFLGIENQALEQNEIANSASDVDARVGVLGRLLFGASAPHWTLALDAELSPMRLRKEFKIFRYLPAVSVGLGFGVALESP